MAQMDVYRDRPARISWKLPLFCNNDWAAIKLLRKCEELGIERPFDRVYGTPWCAWSSGRTSAIRQQLTEEELEKYFKAYAAYGVKVALTWSRLDVDKKVLSNEYCNLILDVAARYDAQIILCNERLRKYIRNKYPELTLIAGINNAMIDLKDENRNETAYYRQPLEKYDRVVVRGEYAIDGGISDLKDVADRVEYIANLVCVRSCQACRKHVKSIEDQDDMPQFAQAHDCFYRSAMNDVNKWMQMNVCVCETRIKELAAEGFTSVKLAGRNIGINALLDMLGDYVFEPTGVYTGINQSIMAEYKALSERMGTRLPQHMIPFS